MSFRPSVRLSFHQIDQPTRTHTCHMFNSSHSFIRSGQSIQSCMHACMMTVCVLLQLLTIAAVAAAAAAAADDVVRLTMFHQHTLTHTEQQIKMLNK